MIITFLDDLKDHRRSHGQRYELRFIVLFSIMAILVLSFFDTQSGLILAHETIDVKTNEIPRVLDSVICVERQTSVFSTQRKDIQRQK